MRTRAERARALLISLVCLDSWGKRLWKFYVAPESITCSSLESKTPYEAKHNKKPYLGVSRIRTIAYVKDLNAGKLDSRACVGRFVVMIPNLKDLESMAEKASITVERNGCIQSKRRTSLLIRQLQSLVYCLRGRWKVIKSSSTINPVEPTKSQR